MIGTTLSHYRIADRIGAGGMGEVFRATDTKLGRDVALKVLPPEMASHPEHLIRFRREAKTVAALNHPHIVTIFSVEEHDGVHFLTMEMVEGRGLDEILRTEGALARDVFFDVAVPLADAVAAAHTRGIVHRDLKPANLKLDAEGRLKVLDFGIARVASGSETTRIEPGSPVTAPGGVVGTAPYMSPEQANGHRVDERSDVFSLGTVLYELATGRRPFDGDSLPAVLYAVVSHEPEPVSAVRRDLTGLDWIVTECLVKDVARRRFTAAKVRNGLGSLSRDLDGSATPTTAAGGTAEKHLARMSTDKTKQSRRPVIAVLPFRSAGGDSELNEFAANLGSDVVDGVTNTSQAQVLPGSTTARFRGADIDACQVGTEAGAGYVVQGSVRRNGKRLRVTAQLTSVENGTQIWSHQYDRDLDRMDLFDAGDDIGGQIVSAVSDVHGVIFEIERQRLEGRSVGDLDPWECIFVTLAYDKFIDEVHHRIAGEALDRAISLEPGFPLAWGYMSWIITDEVVYGFNRKPDSMQRAMTAARRALELDPRSHMLRWLLSRVHFFEGNIEGFLSEGNRALELNSNDAAVIGLIGLYSSFSGHWGRGEELMRRAMGLNPDHPSYYHLAFGLNQFRQGNYEEALAEYRRLTFSNPFVQVSMAATLGRLGRLDEAGATLQEFRSQAFDGSSEAIRAMYTRWNVKGDLLESLMDGLNMAEEAN